MNKYKRTGIGVLVLVSVVVPTWYKIERLHSTKEKVDKAEAGVVDVIEDIKRNRGSELEKQKQHAITRDQFKAARIGVSEGIIIDRFGQPDNSRLIELEGRERCIYYNALEPILDFEKDLDDLAQLRESQLRESQLESSWQAYSSAVTEFNKSERTYELCFDRARQLEKKMVF